MKVKISVPENVSNWPTQYQGHTVECEVIGLKFPDGMEWSLYEDEMRSLVTPIEAKTEVGEKSKQSLPEIFGQELKEMTVIFK